MVVTFLLLLFGVPVIVGLTLTAVRRARALTQRIEEVQEEMARNPQAPYAALAALMQEREQADSGRTAHVWPPAPRGLRRGEDGHRNG